MKIGNRSGDTYNVQFFVTILIQFRTAVQLGMNVSETDPVAT